MVDYALEAVSVWVAMVVRYLLERVEALQLDEVSKIVGRVSTLSEPAATFVIELLAINRRRLLSAGLTRYRLA